jgi:hypothetical protein
MGGQLGQEGIVVVVILGRIQRHKHGHDPMEEGEKEASLCK